MNKQTVTFALYFGNRGFFPGELIASARLEMMRAVERAGCRYILMDEQETRYGAVETMEEGQKYAAFLKAHEGEYDGVILSLPNFGDENGAIYALRDCGVPILIQAYPDEIGKMDFDHRGTLSAANFPSWTCSASTACPSPCSSPMWRIRTARISPGTCGISRRSAGW